MGLRVQLLGTLKVATTTASPDVPPRSRVPVLLAFLLLEARSPVSREEAASKLWPDSSEVDGRAQLRRHLYRLRSWLPEPAAGGDWILAERESLQWNPDLDCSVDAWSFLELSQIPAAAEQALEHYGGDFLPYFYEGWVLGQRERLRDIYLSTLAQAVQNRQSEHDYLPAIEYCQRLLREEPLREDVYRLLMELHAQNGDRAGIVRYYKLCEAVLERELDVGPSEQTKTHYEDLVAAAAPETTRPPEPSQLAAQDNLPAHLTRFIGREQEQAELLALLQNHRLVTLTGVGGVGKSRLALQVAGDWMQQSPGGVWWVELSSLDRPDQIPQAVASALGLRATGDVPLEQALTDLLQGRQALLLLDSCEHMGAAAARFSERLLQEADGLSLLATSREPLGLAGERIYRLLPLTAPPQSVRAENMEAINQLRDRYPSLELLDELAAANNPTFRLTPANVAAAAEVCATLDGLPLALELAAARLRALSIEQLAARLEDRFRVLADGPVTMPARHQTLKATLDWSYDQLSEPEQRLFRRLAVFSGSFSLEPVEAVCPGSGVEPDAILGLVSELVDKSLVSVEYGRSARTRYHLLETVSAYAREKLTVAGEVEQFERVHASLYFDLAREAAQRLLRGSDEGFWLERLDAEFANLRAALRRAADWQDFDDLAGVAGSLWAYWWTRGLVVEGWHWLQDCLDRRQELRAENLALALHGAGRLRLLQGASQEAMTYLEESLHAARQQGPSAQLAECLISVGVCANRLGNYDRADELWQEARREYAAIGDSWGVARALNNLGDSALHQGQVERAVQLLEQSRHAFKDAGSTFGESVCLINLGRAWLLLDEPGSARDQFLAALELKVLLKDKEGLAWTLEGMAAVAAHQDQPHVGARLFGAADALRTEIAVPVAEADRDFYQDQIDHAHAQMDNANWDAAWKEGSDMNLEAAIELARSLSR